jgi:hypothetical protein
MTASTSCGSGAGCWNGHSAEPAALIRRRKAGRSLSPRSTSGTWLLPQHAHCTSPVATTP